MPLQSTQRDPWHIEIRGTTRSLDINFWSRGSVDGLTLSWRGMFIFWNVSFSFLLSFSSKVNLFVFQTNVPVESSEVGIPSEVLEPCEFNIKDQNKPKRTVLQRPCGVVEKIANGATSKKTSLGVLLLLFSDLRRGLNPPHLRSQKTKQPSLSLAFQKFQL